MPAESVNIPLSAPIKAHGQDVSALTLRPLRARELRLHGFPFLLRQSAGAVTEELNAPVIAAIIADLAGIPPSSVDTLQPADWMEAVNAIRGFLLGSSPNGSSPLPGA